ncbi:hypothetical protein [Streptomyces sp. NPDC046909]|uniref:hypothetical protein n=1 Tax=Streptomyces sp. NPDC046909 TaxID=3155617 RepID=UPI00340E9B68
MSSFTPPPYPPPRPPGPSHKWQTLAALISAGVGILTFAVGFIGLPAAGVRSPVAVRETATVTATATATVTTSAEPVVQSENPDGGDSTPPDAEVPEVQWTGPLLSQQQGFDLDLVPPERGGGDIDTYGFDGPKAKLYGNSYALVPEGEDPDFSECKLLATTKTQSAPAVADGRSVCLFTDGGRVALATVDSADPGTGIVNLTVKVWEKATT